MNWPAVENRGPERILLRGDDPRLGSITGLRVDGLITLANAAAGFALFGGYCSLEAGEYRAFVWLSPQIAAAGRGQIDVCAAAGRDVLNQAAFDTAWLSQEAPFIDIAFTLPSHADDVEIRLQGHSGLTLAVKGVEIIRIGPGPEPAQTSARPAASARRPLNILYCSCHETLEFDELRMLTGQGHRVFSLGAYTDPSATGHLRRALPQFHHAEAWERYRAEGLSLALARAFDVTIVMHQPEKVAEIVAVRPDMPVIYRSIGQSTVATEAFIRRYAAQMKVVRYSEREAHLPGFLPADAVIHFGKYPEEFATPWQGGDRILTFHNGYLGRKDVSVPPLEAYQQLARRWPMDLYGAANDHIPGSRGTASPALQMQLYSNAALYLYIYTMGPSYTLSFMEAMGAGLPIMAPTAELVSRTLHPDVVERGCFLAGSGRYAIEDLLDHDPALLYSSLDEAHDKIGWLMANEAYRRDVSARLRARFSEKFDARIIARQWDEILYASVDGA